MRKMGRPIPAQAAHGKPTPQVHLRELLAAHSKSCPAYQHCPHSSAILYILVNIPVPQSPSSPERCYQIRVPLITTPHKAFVDGSLLAGMMKRSRSRFLTTLKEGWATDTIKASSSEYARRHGILFTLATRS
uniref:Uncharacterized protein n=1 Tax=Coccidioides posadasii RMSCC 3488 TaxID=454284 RepID=A0A0J6FV93_COCPO|nr:hypothetical protein CPAG_09649 [Coccidioides posadasii RMSCC 3488]